MGTHIVVSAGEASGDALAAGLIRALRARAPAVAVSGVGGPAMAAAGAELIGHYAPLAVMGHWDALRNLPAILSLRRALLAHLEKTRPALFVGVDAPDFNLGVAEAARGRGARAGQYVSPTVWMWRRNRVARIARAVDEVWCLFPFEPALYAGTQATARFVGHPAAESPPPDADEVREARRRLGLEAERRPVVALLPGSRAPELRRHLPLFAAVMQRMPDACFVAAAADPRTAQMMREGFARHIDWIGVEVVVGETRTVFAAADAALVKSGTATLEGALCLTPLVAVYKLGAMADLLRRCFQFHLPFAALPNILAGRFVVPEFLLEEADAGDIAWALRRVLRDKERRRRMRTAFAALRGQLAQDGAARAATAALALLGKAAS